MSDTSLDAPVDARPPIRALPARPRLDFERKQAKVLLRALRDGDAVAVARAHEVGERAATSREWQLADAQRIVAREYGFASWPKLVKWFEALERQGSPGDGHDRFTRAQYVQRVDGFFREYDARQEWVARALASYVPRWFGVAVNDVWTATPTRAEVEQLIARFHGYESWAVLMELTPETRPERDDWALTPHQQAWRVLQDADLPALEALVEQHPELLRNDERRSKRGDHLMSAALAGERKLGRDALRPIMAWLESRGFNRQYTLDVQLTTPFGHYELDECLAQGANPNAVLSNGIPVLEHALLGMWNPAKLDRLAARATAREALWIAAGLGDIAGMARMLDARGKPLPKARLIRPHFEVVFPGGGGAPHPNPSEYDLLSEAMFVAAMNDRAESLTYLVSRGAPVDSMWWSMTPLGVATGNARVKAVGALLKLGADVDARIAMQGESARSLARSMWLNRMPRGADARETAALFGWDPYALLAERIAQNPLPPLDERAEAVLAHARHDAAAQGAHAVEPLHLLIAFLGSRGAFFILNRGLDRDRFLAQFGPRLARPATPLGESIPLDERSVDLIEGARRARGADGRGSVSPHNIMHALLYDAQVTALLGAYGVDIDTLANELARA